MPHQVERGGVVGSLVVRDPADHRVDGRAAELLLADLFADRGLHQWRPRAEQRRALDHHDEVHERRGERAVSGRRPHDHAHRGDETGERHQRLEVVRGAAATFECVLGPVTGALEQHHERHPLLLGQLGEPVPFGTGRQSDRATHHGEVLGTDQHRATVDRAVTGDERVGRRNRRDSALHGSGERAELDERVGVEQPRDALAGVEAATLALAFESFRPTHPPRLGVAGVEIIEQRLPGVIMVRFAAPPRSPTDLGPRGTVRRLRCAHERVAATASAWLSPLPNTVSSTHARFR